MAMPITATITTTVEQRDDRATHCNRFKTSWWIFTTSLNRINTPNGYCNCTPSMWEYTSSSRANLTWENSHLNSINKCTLNFPKTRTKNSLFPNILKLLSKAETETCNRTIMRVRTIRLCRKLMVRTLQKNRTGDKISTKTNSVSVKTQTTISTNPTITDYNQSNNNKHRTKAILANNINTSCPRIKNYNHPNLTESISWISSKSVNKYYKDRKDKWKTKLKPWKDLSTNLSTLSLKTMIEFKSQSWIKTTSRTSGLISTLTLGSALKKSTKLAKKSTKSASLPKTLSGPFHKIKSNKFQAIKT